MLSAFSAAPAAAGGTLTDYRLLVLDGTRVKWGAPVLGSGAAITYAVVDRDRHFAGARNCVDIGAMDGLLLQNGVARAIFDRELKGAFAAWSAAANVTFVEGTAAAANILIGAEAERRGRAFTNVAYDRAQPTAAARSIGQSLICLNPTEPWKVGFDGNLDSYDLRYTLEHEIGHAIGLDHPGGAGALMGFRYLERFRAPQAGDISGAVALYGPTGSGETVAIIPKPPTPAGIGPPPEEPALAIGGPGR
jgi:hypothetical protein